MRVPEQILNLVPYQPGKPISETKRELGLSTVYKLASNEHPFGVSPKVAAAIASAIPELHLYPDGASHEMTQAVAKYLKVSPEELAFGNGSDELIGLLLKIFCRPGDSILTADKAFIAYKISAQAAQVQPILTKMSANLSYDFGAMSEALKVDDTIRMVFLANPNNPTGTYKGYQDLEALLRLAASKDVLVVLDEAYHDYVAASDYKSGLELRKSHPNLLTLRTFSKAFGLAGLRVGYVVGPKEVTGLIHRVRVPFNVNSLAQVAVVAALNDLDFVSKGVEHNAIERVRVAKALSDLGFLVTPSQTNFLLFDTGMEARAIFDFVLKKGVILRPLANYGMPTHLRMSLGLVHENDAALEALRGFRELGKRGS